MDECQTLPGACGYTGQTCVNSLGSFDCKCSPGFYQVGYKSGEDLCEGNELISLPSYYVIVTCDDFASLKCFFHLIPFCNVCWSAGKKKVVEK